MKESAKVPIKTVWHASGTAGVAVGLLDELLNPKHSTLNPIQDPKQRGFVQDRWVGLKDEIALRLSPRILVPRHVECCAITKSLMETTLNPKPLSC